jgi:hypothetical protein
VWLLLRVVDERWSFPPYCHLASQPLAALDLLDYPPSVDSSTSAMSAPVAGARLASR